MNRQDFQELADLRLREAGVLLAAGCWHGAYYLGGYAVECALKACIAKRTKEHDFPDKSQVNRSHTHNLDVLLDLALLVDECEKESIADAQFGRFWTTVCDWSEDARYNNNIDEARGRELVTAVNDPIHGVVAWLKKWW